MQTPDGAGDPLSSGRVHGRLIRKNVSVVAVAYVVGALAGFVALAYMARTLGDATFGIYVAAVALVNVVGVIDALGGGQYLVREVARNPARMTALLGDVLTLKTGANVLVIVVSVAMAAALNFGSTEMVVVGIVAFMFGANAISRTFRAGLQALERLEIASAITIGNAVLSAIGIIAVLAAGGGLVEAVAISAAVSVATIPVSWVVLHRRIAFRLGSGWPTVRRVAIASFPFAVAAILTAGVTYADTLVIKGFLGNRQTGLYGAAVRITSALMFIPSIYLDSVYRTLSHLAKVGTRTFGEFVDRSATWLCLAALPLAAGGTVLGGRVLTLVFGPSYAPATDAFRVLLWSLVLEFPSWLLMPAVTVDRPWTSARIVGVGLGLNLGLNLLLVPRFGILAAAWLTFATGAFTTIVPTVVLARRRGMRVRWPLMALPGVGVAVVMALAIYPLRHAPLVLPIAVGAVIYVGGLLITGVAARLGFTWSAVRRVLRRDWRASSPTPS